MTVSVASSHAGSSVTVGSGRCSVQHIDGWLGSGTGGSLDRGKMLSRHLMTASFSQVLWCLGGLWDNGNSPQSRAAISGFHHQMER